MNALSSEVQADANGEVLYNVYTYIAHHGKGQGKGSVSGNETTFLSLVKELRRTYSANPSDWTADEYAQLEVLERALAKEQNSNIAESKLVASTLDANGMNAFVFESGNDVSVVYRGTAAGEWIDNGEGLDGVPEENTYYTYDSKGNVIDSNTVIDYATDQQVEAFNWFNKVAAQQGWKESNNITVTGHSKGGNKAQFIALNAELVDTCYSFDGQGFSPEAIDYYKKMYGEEFEERVKKMYSFAADNDYVNILGERLIPEEHIYYFEAPAGDTEILKYHYIDSMLDGEGNFNTQTEQGEMSVYLQSVSEDLMKMDPEVRKYATLGLMNLLQRLYAGGTPVNGDYVSWTDTGKGVAISLYPLILNALSDENVNKAINEAAKAILGDEYYKKLVETIEKYPIIDGVGDAVLGVAVAAIRGFLGAICVTGGIAIDFIEMTVDLLCKIGEKIKAVCVGIYNEVSSFISSTIAKLKKWTTKIFNPGSAYANENPNIAVNTASLRAYAERLRKVNQRIARLDRRMDSLYTQVNLLDLWDLLQADVLTGHSWRIDRCISYLDNTATDFENVERTIVTS